MIKHFIKFSEWIRLKEETVAGGSSGSSGGGNSGEASGGESSGHVGGDSSASDSTNKTNNIAIRPSVIGCGYCYPFCTCGKIKKKKKKSRRKRKK